MRGAMKRDVRELIAELAGLIRKYIKIDEFTVIDEEKAIKALGGKIIYDVPSRELGYVKRIGKDSFEIHVPKVLELEKNRPKRRWLIFRLVGHLILHMCYMIDETAWEAADTYKEPDHSSLEYVEACEFARYMIMPRNDYVRVLKQCEVTVTIDDKEQADLSPIVKHFIVPTHIVIQQGLRLGELLWE